MKGYFQLNHDPYSGELRFCNLPDASLGFLRDSFNSRSRLGELVAHDVVEHSLTHRKRKYVTYEDEIRALGASAFVRPSHFNGYEQVMYQCMDTQREIKPVPAIIAKFLRDDYRACADMMRYLVKEGIEPCSARNATYQYEWGRYQKELQFDFDYYQAHQAFSLIERNVEHVCHEVSDKDSWGASIYFDTKKHIFRHQMKWSN